MDLLPYLIAFAIGIIAGGFLEARYGAKLSAENLAAHAARSKRRRRKWRPLLLRFNQL